MSRENPGPAEGQPIDDEELESLLERSSLGTPGARALRGRISLIDLGRMYYQAGQRDDADRAWADAETAGEPGVASARREEEAHAARVADQQDPRRARWARLRTERRDEIAKATRRVLANVGPDFTLEQVAEEVGTPESVLNLHFADKDDLLEAVGEHGDESTSPPDTRARQPFSDRARALRRGEDHRASDVDLHPDVVALLRRALASAEPDAPGLLAEIHLGRGELQEAIDVLVPAVYEQDRVDLAGLLGEALAALGDHARAEDAFLVALAAGDLRAASDYGVFLRDRGRAQEASYVLDRAARGGDELAPLNLVSLHLEVLDDAETAVAVAERFHDEARPSTLIALADARLATGRLAEAERLYRRAAELGATCAHLYLAWFLLDRRRDPAAAERSLWRAHELGEEGAAVALARFLFDAGRRDEALPLFEQAARGGDAVAQDTLEVEYLGLGLVDRYDD